VGVIRRLNLEGRVGSGRASRALALDAVGPDVEDLRNLHLDASNGTKPVGAGGGGEDEVLEGAGEVEVAVEVGEEHGGGEAKHLESRAKPSNQPSEREGGVGDGGEALGKGEAVRGGASDAALSHRPRGEEGGGASAEDLHPGGQAGSSKDQGHAKPREVIQGGPRRREAKEALAAPCRWAHLQLSGAG
jgi:hypothetical protein